MSEKRVTTKLRKSTHRALKLYAVQNDLSLDSAVCKLLANKEHTPEKVVGVMRGIAAKEELRQNEAVTHDKVDFVSENPFNKAKTVHRTLTDKPLASDFNPVPKKGKKK